MMKCIFPRISSASRPIVLYCFEGISIEWPSCQTASHHIVLGDMRLDALLRDTGRGNSHMHQYSNMNEDEPIIFGFLDIVGSTSTCWCCEMRARTPRYVQRTLGKCTHYGSRFLYQRDEIALVLNEQEFRNPAACDWARSKLDRLCCRDPKTHTRLVAWLLVYKHVDSPDVLWCATVVSSPGSSIDSRNAISRFRHARNTRGDSVKRNIASITVIITVTHFHFLCMPLALVMSLRDAASRQETSQTSQWYCFDKTESCCRARVASFCFSLFRLFRALNSGVGFSRKAF